MNKKPAVLILAGGLGTRLRSVVNIPKCLAPIQDVPFIHYLLEYLISQQFSEVILSVGHQSELVLEAVGKQYKSLKIDYVVEETPLGTGGAVKLAFENISTDKLIVLNGDTFFPIGLRQLIDTHATTKADATLALKPLKSFDRYGAVVTNSENQILQFDEKKWVDDGKINGGVFIVNRDAFMETSADFQKFSIETDYFQNHCANRHFVGMSSDTYFIDIGIPEDYKTANELLPKFLDTDIYQTPLLKSWNIDNTWTLFLDRDGVINERLISNYVKTIAEFKFIDGAKEAIKMFSGLFATTVVVTNQQGIGKQKMTTETLHEIHTYMNTEVEKVGGKINKVYFAPDLASETNLLRKPNTGMAMLAKQDFPHIDFSKSILVGDSHTDIQFGEHCGMKTVFIGSKPHPTAHITVSSLQQFSVLLKGLLGS